MTVNAGTMMTTSGQAFATSTGNIPQQMFSGAGKPTFMMVNQPGYVPVNANQTMMFKQFGAATNGQSVFTSKALSTSQKEKTFTYQNQLTALQPNTFYVSTAPALPSSQVLNGSHIREISSQPQIITAQGSGPLLNQAQLLGLQTVNPLQPGFSWAPTSLQLHQNPMIFHDQQSGVRMAMFLPVSAAPQPNPSTFVYSNVAPPMRQQFRCTEKVKNLITRSSGTTPILPRHPITSIHPHVNQTLPTTVAQQKLISDCQTDSNQVKIVNDVAISTGILTKPVSLQAKISLPQNSQTISPAYVAPIIDISDKTTPSPSTIALSSGVSAPPLNVQLTTADAHGNQVPSIPVAQQKFVAAQPTDPNSVQIVNKEKMLTEIKSKPVSVETENSSPQKSQPKDPTLSDIPNLCLSPSSTVDVSAVSTAPSPLTSESSTMSAIIKSTVQVEAPVSSIDTISSNITNTCLIPTSTADVSFISKAPSTLPVETSPMSVSTKSSVQVDTSVSSVDTISSVPTASPDPCLTDRVSFDFNSKPSLPKANNEAVFTSDQTNSTDFVITTDHLNPQKAIQQITSDPVKGKQKAIVKPQVLTHVINGFIIQESSEPFPVSQSPLLDLQCRKSPVDKLNSSAEKKIKSTEKKTRILRPRSIVELVKCAFCGKPGSHFRIKKKKRFCSKSCVKQFNKSNSKHVQIPATSVQEHVGSGGHSRKRKKQRGRKRMQKEASVLMESTNIVEKENTSIVIAEENPSTIGNELTVSCKTGEKNSTSENESTISCKTEENSVPENESTVSNETDENAAPENKLLDFYITGKEVAAPENESMVSYKTGEDVAVPENESIVSCKTGEEKSACDYPDETPMKVDILNYEVGKLKYDLTQKLPSKWTVEDVYEFVQNFPGSSDYADNFKSQEVDGQVLLLLNVDHLMASLCMKLGPALKLLSHIRCMEKNLEISAT